MQCANLSRIKYATTKIVFLLPNGAPSARRLRWDRRLRLRPISSREPSSLAESEVGATNPSATTATPARYTHKNFATLTPRNIIVHTRTKHHFGKNKKVAYRLRRFRACGRLVWRTHRSRDRHARRRRAGRGDDDGAGAAYQRAPARSARFDFFYRSLT